MIQNDKYTLITVCRRIIFTLYLLNPRTTNKKEEKNRENKGKRRKVNKINPKNQKRSVAKRKTWEK